MPPDAHGRGFGLTRETRAYSLQLAALGGWGWLGVAGCEQRSCERRWGEGGGPASEGLRSADRQVDVLSDEVHRCHGAVDLARGKHLDSAEVKRVGVEGGDEAAEEDAVLEGREQGGFLGGQHGAVGGVGQRSVEERC